MSPEPQIIKHRTPFNPVAQIGQPPRAPQLRTAGPTDADVVKHGRLDHKFPIRLQPRSPVEYLQGFSAHQLTVA
jgi:hypothetical protein